MSTRMCVYVTWRPRTRCDHEDEQGNIYDSSGERNKQVKNERDVFHSSKSSSSSRHEEEESEGDVKIGNRHDQEKLQQ